MKKLLLLPFIIILLVSSVWPSTLIYKGTLIRKNAYDYTPSETIAIASNFSQIRVVTVRTNDGGDTNRFPQMAVYVESDFDDAHFILAASRDFVGSCSILIDTPPPSITVIPKNMLGTFKIFVWGT